MDAHASIVDGFVNLSAPFSPPLFPRCTTEAVLSGAFARKAATSIGARRRRVCIDSKCKRVRLPWPKHSFCRRFAWDKGDGSPALSNFLQFIRAERIRQCGNVIPPSVCSSVPRVFLAGSWYPPVCSSGQTRRRRSAWTLEEVIGCFVADETGSAFFFETLGVDKVTKSSKSCGTKFERVRV